MTPPRATHSIDQFSASHGPVTDTGVQCVQLEASEVFAGFPEKCPQAKWKLIKKVFCVFGEENLHWPLAVC